MIVPSPLPADTVAVLVTVEPDSTDVVGLLKLIVLLAFAIVAFRLPVALAE